MLALGLPMIIVWVIGAPLLALIIIYRNRKDLDNWKVKKYLILLYQGLKPHAFYWEFVNTGRKLIVLSIITFSSQIKVSYQILLSSTCVLLLLRAQIRLKPYKREENNSIEILGTISSIITIFSLVLFVEDQRLIGFTVLATILMFAFNIVFILQWLFLFMRSWNIKNPHFMNFLKLYSVIV